MKRALLSALVLLATWLSLEGLLALAGRPGLLQRLLPESVPGPQPVVAFLIPDDLRDAAGVVNSGPSRLHPDPLVGYTLRHHAELEMLGVPVHSDGLGLRRPPGPEPRPEALSIAVLGASVPFGLGVPVEEALPAQLERLLEAAGAGPVACRAVAVPRWSHRNAVHFLIDHWDLLAPDIVLAMPLWNELGDTDVVTETGHRYPWPDAANVDPWQLMGTDAMILLQEPFRQAIASGRSLLSEEDLGPLALFADLSPTSSRRYDASAASLALLAERARLRGTRLGVLVYQQDQHSWHLLRRVRAWEKSPPLISLFRTIPKSFTLVLDAHPNATTHRVMALLVARRLLEMGWVDGEPGLLPTVPEEYERFLATGPGPHGIVTASDQARKKARELLRDEIDFESGVGIAQVFGGVDPSRLAGMRVLVVLAASGPRVQVVLAPLEGRPDLRPLAVEVWVDGVEVGRVALSTRPVEAWFERPAGGDVIELQLRPERWVVLRGARAQQLASFRPLRLACPAP